MTIRVFYDSRDFFGNWQHNIENATEITSPEELMNALKKCFYSFGRVRSLAFRIEADGENWLIEQSIEDAQNAVYTVTHSCGRSVDVPVKMSAAAIRKLAKDHFSAVA